jgi:transmembrane sensor
MSRRDDILHEERTSEAAAVWFTRLQQADASGDDWLAFERWLATSPAHAAAYDRLEALSSELDELAPELRRALAAPEPRPAERHRRAGMAVTRRRWLAGGGAAVAAGLAGVIVLRPEMRPALFASPAAAATIYEAIPGQTREVQLADGTRIKMNAGSRLSVRFDRDARHVEMAEAEAAFDVAHDPNRPFLIQVGDREVRVVGTEFNLRRRAGKVVLTVRRGLVEVRRAGDAAADPQRVAPGQQLTHVEASGSSLLAAVNPEEAFGWTSGRLICRDQPLSELAAELGRHFGRSIRVADAETGAARFTGVLVLDEEGAVMNRLAAMAAVQVTNSPDGSVTLRRRA